MSKTKIQNLPLMENKKQSTLLNFLGSKRNGSNSNSNVNDNVNNNINVNVKENNIISNNSNNRNNNRNNSGNERHEANKENCNDLNLFNERHVGNCEFSPIKKIAVNNFKPKNSLGFISNSAVRKIDDGNMVDQKQDSINFNTNNEKAVIKKSSLEKKSKSNSNCGINSIKESNEIKTIFKIKSNNYNNDKENKEYHEVIEKKSKNYGKIEDFINNNNSYNNNKLFTNGYNSSSVNNKSTNFNTQNTINTINTNNTNNNTLKTTRTDINTFFGKLFYPADTELFRQYQYDIVKSCIKENTLVCIPTGLGKTFIASVIIYNYHLWFKGKIFFLAPTKPLVNQQQNSFSKLFKGLRTVEITGRSSAKTRYKLYNENKIFFMTPQTLDNDLKNGNVPGSESTSLVIFDEAHKAQKNYAYVNVVNRLEESKRKNSSLSCNNNYDSIVDGNNDVCFNQGKMVVEEEIDVIKQERMISENLKFRIIGLTASPGTSFESIQNVISSLHITSIELRTEQDEEIKKYSHNKKIQIAEINEESNQLNLGKLLDKLLLSRLEVMKKYNICEKKVTATYLSTWFLLKVQENFTKNRCNFEEEYGKPMVSEIYENFSLLHNLVRAKKLLNTQGVEALKKCVGGIENPCFFKNSKKTKNYVNRFAGSGFKSKGKEYAFKRDDECEKMDGTYDSISKSKLKDFQENFSHFKTYQSKEKHEKLNKLQNNMLKSKARQNLISSQDFLSLKFELFERTKSTTEKKDTLHPKLKTLYDIIRSNQVGLERTSKAIIFTQFKDSAKEIQEFIQSRFMTGSNNINNNNNSNNGNESNLNCNTNSSTNLLTSEIFHGQDKKFNQKDQKKIMDKFREGDIRILIATSVAEEGLDIGEVDLIICYDMLSSSPIRMIQRFGRTGRKRDGVVIVLAMKGEEKSKYFQCLSKLRCVNDELRNLGNGFKNSKIKLSNGENNLFINKNCIEEIEYFEIQNEVIDNADEDFNGDFYYESSENDEDLEGNEDDENFDSDLSDFSCNSNTKSKRRSKKIDSKNRLSSNDFFVEIDEYENCSDDNKTNKNNKKKNSSKRNFFNNNSISKKKNNNSLNSNKISTDISSFNTYNNLNPFNNKEYEINEIIIEEDENNVNLTNKLNVSDSIIEKINNKDTNKENKENIKPISKKTLNFTFNKPLKIIDSSNINNNTCNIFNNNNYNNTSLINNIENNSNNNIKQNITAVNNNNIDNSINNNTKINNKVKNDEDFCNFAQTLNTLNLENNNNNNNNNNKTISKSSIKNLLKKQLDKMNNNNNNNNKNPIITRVVYPNEPSTYDNKEASFKNEFSNSERKQYSSIFNNRLLKLKPLLINTIKRKFPGIFINDDLLQIQGTQDQAIIGITFKNMPLRPNILKGIDVVNESRNKKSFISEKDELFIEGTAGRLKLKFIEEQTAFNEGDFISGLVCGIM